ncbi:MAG: hypothetical protein ABIG84_01480 [archaeon]
MTTMSSLHTFDKAIHTYYNKAWRLPERTPYEQVIKAITNFKKTLDDHDGTDPFRIYVSARGRSGAIGRYGMEVCKKIAKQAGKEIEISSTHDKKELDDKYDFAFLLTSSGTTGTVYEDLDRAILYNIPGILLVGDETSIIPKYLDYNTNSRIITVKNPSQSKLSKIKSKDDTINIQGTSFEQDIYPFLIATIYSALSKENESIYTSLINALAKNILELKNIDSDRITEITYLCATYLKEKDDSKIRLTLEGKKDTNNCYIPYAVKVRLNQSDELDVSFNEESEPDMVISYTDGCIEISYKTNHKPIKIDIPWQQYHKELDSGISKLPEELWKEIQTSNNTIVFSDALTAAMLKRINSDTKIMQKKHKKDTIKH